MQNISSFITYMNLKWLGSYNTMTIHVCTPERFGDKISKILFQREIDRCLSLFQIIRQVARTPTFLTPLAREGYTDVRTYVRTELL